MTCLESLLNVSVVKDDEAVRKSLKNLLRSAGHRVKLFACAEEFFAAAASLDAKSRALAVEAGADAYFVKPLDSGVLLACVESWSSGPSGREGR